MIILIINETYFQNSVINEQKFKMIIVQILQVRTEAQKDLQI